MTSLKHRRLKNISVGGKHSVSALIDQALADHCVSRVAASFGNIVQKKRYEKRAKVYKLSWDKSTRLFSPFTISTDGRVNRTSRSMTDSFEFTESNAEQYSWALQFDFNEHIQQRGGIKKYIEDLDFFFTRAGSATGPDTDGMNFHGFSAGNEVTMHTPYLYALAGAPSKSQLLVDFLVKNMYSSEVDGLPGNDDFGQ